MNNRVLASAALLGAAAMFGARTASSAPTNKEISMQQAKQPVLVEARKLHDLTLAAYELSQQASAGSKGRDAAGKIRKLLYPSNPSFGTAPAGAVACASTAAAIPEEYGGYLDTCLDNAQRDLRDILTSLIGTDGQELREALDKAVAQIAVVRSANSQVTNLVKAREVWR